MIWSDGAAELRTRSTDRRGKVRLPRLTHPAQVISAGFLAAIGVGTVLLLLPVSKAGPGGASFMEALFTATSAVCVTGLTVVDTPVFWSGFGHVVILLLVQVGGFGIMAFATLLGLLAAKRFGLRGRMNAAAETHSLGLQNVRQILFGIARTMLLFELAGAAILSCWLAVRYDEPWPDALWSGFFHSVSAFNNAGFALYSDSLTRFVDDWVVNGTISVLVIAGALGFPVLFELRRAWRKPRAWSLHTKIVTVTSGVLLLAATEMFLVLEWTNARTLGLLDVPGKVLAAFFHSVQTRSGGFNTVDVAAMSPETHLGATMFMFIGGGPAGTGGGIKVTTFAILLFIVVSEARGDDSVIAFRRKIPKDLQRQALSVLLLAVGLIAFATMLLLIMTGLKSEQVLFEVMSAACTVGLSTGISSQVGPAAQFVLVVLMFLGRIGPVTLASALALRSRPRLYDVPEERPIVG